MNSSYWEELNGLDLFKSISRYTVRVEGCFLVTSLRSWTEFFSVPSDESLSFCYC